MASCGMGTALLECHYEVMSGIGTPGVLILLPYTYNIWKAALPNVVANDMALLTAQCGASFIGE
jgi:hypothetical protein